MNYVHFNLCITCITNLLIHVIALKGWGNFHLGGGIFMAKTPFLGHKNSKISLKKLHIIIVKWSALLLTTEKNQGHARICEIYEIHNNEKFDYKQIKYLIFQIKEQACPMGGRMLTYHTQVTINMLDYYYIPVTIL